MRKAAPIVGGMTFLNMNLMGYRKNDGSWIQVSVNGASDAIDGHRPENQRRRRTFCDDVLLSQKSAQVPRLESRTIYFIHGGFKSLPCNPPIACPRLEPCLTYPSSASDHLWSTAHRVGRRLIRGLKHSETPDAVARNAYARYGCGRAVAGSGPRWWQDDSLMPSATRNLYRLSRAVAIRGLRQPT